ncbi:MAG TPA: hypothetical protein VJJ21_03005 [Candidatus Nanoarchaeia archaeon]|nr:hypothetical protein [Candidatus Nanoarchaeia archaeon]
MLENKLNQREPRGRVKPENVDPVRRAVDYFIIAVAAGTILTTAYNLAASPVEIPQTKELTIRPY